MELALDTADLAAAGPFWAALLTGSADAVHGDDVVEPAGQVPLLWFQHTDAHATPRQRFHLDVWVPHDLAEERIAAAVAAGGTSRRRDERAVVRRAGRHRGQPRLRVHVRGPLRPASVSAGRGARGAAGAAAAVSASGVGSGAGLPSTGCRGRVGRSSRT